MSKKTKSNVMQFDNKEKSLLNLIFPIVANYDTSVKSMIESGTPVLPTEEQFYDNETPIHIYKSFDFKNMSMDPSALERSRNYVAPTPEPSQSVQSSFENAPQ